MKLESVLKLRWRRAVLWTLLAVVVAVLPLVSTPFFNYQVSMIAVFAVAILGLNVVMGYAGQVSLGQSFFLGVGAYAAAYGVGHEWPFLAVLAISIALPGLLGFFIALAAARLQGLALAMVTVALPIVGIPIAKRLSDLTGGATGASVKFLAAPDWSGLASDQWRYYVVVSIAVVAFVLTANLLRGGYGRALRVVQENESVAVAMGVSPYRYKVFAFTVAAMLGGAAGFLYLCIVQYTSPETMSFMTSINMVAGLVIGGAGSIVGSLLGGAYYVLVPTLANQVSAAHSAIISGVLLLVVLLLLPGGIASFPSAIRRLVARGRRRRPSDAVVSDATKATTDTPLPTKE